MLASFVVNASSSRNSFLSLQLNARHLRTIPKEAGILLKRITCYLTRLQELHLGFSANSLTNNSVLDCTITRGTSILRSAIAYPSGHHDELISKYELSHVDDFEEHKLL